MSENQLYAAWLKAQKTAKIAAEAHGWDSEPAAEARKAEDDLFKKLYYPPEDAPKAAG